MITHVDYELLVKVATEHDVVVTIDREVGEFLAEGQHLFRVWGVEDLDEDTRKKLFRAVGLGHEREMQQDVGFGIRQLADIADRALSSGVNDPTTAVQVIDELHRVLRRLVQREAPSPYIADDQGQVRVIHRPQSIEGHLALAVDEIIHYGGDSLQVPRRLRAMLVDLQDVTRERYRTVIVDAIERLDRAVELEKPTPADEGIVDDHQAEARTA